MKRKVIALLIVMIMTLVMSACANSTNRKKVQMKI